MATRTTAGLIGAFCVIFNSGSVGSAEFTGLATEKIEKQKQTKLNLGLAELYEQYQLYLNRGGFALTQQTFKPTNPLIRLFDGYVVIEAAGNDVESLRADLESIGLKNAAVYGRLVSGRLPIDAIPMLHNLPSLRFARPAMSVTHAGSVDSQGDAAMNADGVRPFFGVDGGGIMVGTLSDSYDDQGGAAGDVASGDLPSGVVVRYENHGG